jgi:hypothetical protein
MPMLITFFIGLAGVALPLTAANTVGESCHLVEHRVNVRDDILSVDFDSGAPRGAQSDVQHRTPLRNVDLLAAEHGIAAFGNASLLG